MHRLSAERTAFAFRPDAEPALRVRPGDTVRFETSPAPAERLFAAGDNWPAALDVRAINAVTGPVFIEGVAPGDAVAVDILAIETADWGWNAFIPGFGLADGLLPAPMLRRVPIRDGRVWLTETLAVPLAPMIGCLGLAPASGETSTLGPARPWGGNLDLVQIRPGATVLLPAQVPGGLFSLGDLHAAMGVGEATSVAIECAGAATVRLDIRPGIHLETPRIETPERVWTTGIARSPQYDRARSQAVREMARCLTDERGIEPATAFLLLSAAVDLEFGGPAGAIALASIATSLLSDETASRQVGELTGREVREPPASRRRPHRHSEPQRGIRPLGSEAPSNEDGFLLRRNDEWERVTPPRHLDSSTHHLPTSRRPDLPTPSPLTPRPPPRTVHNDNRRAPQRELGEPG